MTEIGHCDFCSGDLRRLILQTEVECIAGLVACTGVQPVAICDDCARAALASLPGEESTSS